MALASMNPIRLTDARLACAGELLLSSRDLRWLPGLPHMLGSHALHQLDGDAAVTLVLASCRRQVRTGLLVRLRLRDPYAAPEDCAEAREQLLTCAAQYLQANRIAPVRPLAEEGVFTLLPRSGMRFLPRSLPIPGPSAAQLPDPDALETLLLREPGSGLALTLLPADPHASEDAPLDFTAMVWGSGAEALIRLLNRAGLPLRADDAITTDPCDPLPGFEVLYDPWLLSDRLRGMLGQEAAARFTTSAQELRGLFGQPEAETPPAAAVDDLHGLTGAAQQMTRELLGGISGMKGQLLAQTQLLRAGVTQQAARAAGEALNQSKQALAEAAGQLMRAPALQQMQLSERLARLQEQLSLPELLAEAGRAGLNVPLDYLTLLNMGFNTEEELLRAGLPEELLPLLRSAAALYRQCPADCGADFNCMPYAFMLGYLYEALVSRCFHQLFTRAGLKKTAGLSPYDAVTWDKCCLLADFSAFRDPAMKRLAPADWAAWLNLFTCFRLLRNRQHSDQGIPGFISRDELDAAFGAMFFPGQGRKVTLLLLPCFGTDTPVWSRQFRPAVPPQWPGSIPADPHGTLLHHIRQSVAAFTPSLLRLMLSCGDLLPEGGAS